MVTDTWVTLTILLSLVTGTAALTLCLLTWEILRHSAVGRVVAVLTVVMGLFSLYHGITLLVPESELVTGVLKSVTLTGVVLFVAFLIRVDRRVERESSV